MKFDLEDCRLKLSRAREQIVDLEGRIVLYAEDCYVIARENKPKSGQVIFKVDQLIQAPTEFSILAGEILHNLKCPIDYLVCRIAESNGKKIVGQQFPVFRDAKNFTSNIDVRLAGVPPHCVAEFEAMQPYRASKPNDHPLFLLDCLHNRDKHRALEIGTCCVHAAKAYRDKVNTRVLRISTVKALKNGDLIAEYSVLNGIDPSEVYIDIVTAFDVFTKVRLDVVRLCPLLRTLKEIYTYIYENVFANQILTYGLDWNPVYEPFIKQTRSTFLHSHPPELAARLK